MSNFGDKVQAVLADTQIEYAISTDLGDLLPGGKRLLLNFVARHIKKMIPKYSIPDGLKFREVLALGKNSPALKPHRAQQQDVVQSQLEMSKVEERLSRIQQQEEEARARLAEKVGAAAYLELDPQ